MRTAPVEHRVERRSHRDQPPARGLDQPRSHAVSCGQEPVLGEDLGVRSGLWRVTLELQTRKRLDQRDEGGHLRERRLGVHHPDLDGPELGLRSHVPPEEARIGYGPGADHGVERVHVVGVAGEGPRWPGAREGLEDDGAHGVKAAVAPLPERRVRREGDQDRHAAAEAVEEPDRVLRVRHADVDVQRHGRRSAGKRAQRVAEQAVARGAGDCGVLEQGHRVGARRGGREPHRAHFLREPVSQGRELIDHPVDVLVDARLSSMTPACVSGEALSESSSESRARTRSLDWASEELPRSRSISSSSTPSVYRRSSSPFQRAHGGQASSSASGCAWSRLCVACTASSRDVSSATLRRSSATFWRSLTRSAARPRSADPSRWARDSPSAPRRSGSSLGVTGGLARAPGFREPGAAGGRPVGGRRVPGPRARARTAATIRQAGSKGGARGRSGRRA